MSTSWMRVSQCIRHENNNSTDRLTSSRCHIGYVLPFCSPDPTLPVDRRLPSNVDANLTNWPIKWGYDICSNTDQRFVFARVTILFMNNSMPSDLFSLGRHTWIDQ
jgi:hypothetical protein